MVSSSLEEQVAQLQKRVEQNDADVVAHFAEMRLFFREWSAKAGVRFATLEHRMSALEHRVESLEHRVESLENEVRAGFAVVNHRLDRIERLLRTSIKHQGLVNRNADRRLRHLERASSRRRKAS